MECCQQLPAENPEQLPNFQKHLQISVDSRRALLPPWASLQQQRPKPTGASLSYNRRYSLNKSDIQWHTNLLNRKRVQSDQSFGKALQMLQTATVPPSKTEVNVLFLHS